MSSVSPNIRLCIVCGEDISHRSPKAQYCEPCYQTHERELNRARANNAYAERRPEKIAQVQAYAQTPEGQANRLLWRQNNPERIREYKARQRRKYREKMGYKPEGRTCADCNAGISHRGHNAKYCEHCSDSRRSKKVRFCVCGNSLSHRGPKALYCVDECRIRHSRSKEESGTEKSCNQCGEAKPYLEFPSHKGIRTSPCKACRAATARVARENLTPEQRTEKNQKKRAHSANRPPDQKERDKAKQRSRKANRSLDQKKKEKASQRNSLMKRRYGPEFDERALYDSQNGLCAICGVYQPFKVDGDKRSDCLELDHDHDTKKPRGFLCKKCNFKLLPRYEKFPPEHQDSPRINAYLSKGKM